MMFFDDDRAFFTPYESPGDLVVDLSYIVTDPICSLINLSKNLANFLLWSLPLTIGLISFNLPLFLLLSFPIALNLLTLNVPILILMILFAAPAVYSLCLALYDVVDLILSPIVDVIRVITNLATTLIENLPEMEPVWFA